MVSLYGNSFLSTKLQIYIIKRNDYLNKFLFFNVLRPITRTLLSIGTSIKFPPLNSLKNAQSLAPLQTFIKPPLFHDDTNLSAYYFIHDGFIHNDHKRSFLSVLIMTNTNSNLIKEKRSPGIEWILFSGLIILGCISFNQYQQLNVIKKTQIIENQQHATATDNLIDHISSLHHELDSQISQTVEDKTERQKISMASSTQTKQINALKSSFNALFNQVTSLSNHIPTIKPAMGKEELLNRLTLLSDQINQSQLQVKQIVNQSQWPQKIVANYSGGVCLIQGEYRFIDPTSKRPLRYVDSKTVRQTKHFSDNYFHPISTRGEGEIMVVQYTGTGFLIDQNGTVVTNRHVTAPWEISPEYQPVIDAGYEPELSLFRAFFPAHQKPFTLTMMIQSDHEDIALVNADLKNTNVPNLMCEPDHNWLKAGHSVMILGFPTGFDVLLARMNDAELDEILGETGTTFNEMAMRLANKDLIQPIATQGICGRVRGGKIVYDAQTAIGGSGAPVLSNSGHVVGINTALMKGFTGTNFGIPISSALALKQQYLQQHNIINLATDEPSRGY
jgi:S1-C subfamily serine protease